MHIYYQKCPFKFKLLLHVCPENVNKQNWEKKERKYFTNDFPVVLPLRFHPSVCPGPVSGRED